MQILSCKLAEASARIRTSKGVTTLLAGVMPKEIGVLFGGLKTSADDVIEITHRFRNTGKRPFCVFDFKVKNGDGNVVDRVLGSVSDWNKTGTAYSVKWRRPEARTSQLTSLVDDIPTPSVVKDVTKVADKPIGGVKPVQQQIHEPELPFNFVDDIPTPSVVKDVAKVTDKPIAGVLPSQETLKVVTTPVKNEVQGIPNIRDFELEALADPNLRLTTIAELSKTGKQALFNPMTGKPNIFFTYSREEALEYYLRLLGRK